jgi:flagellar motor component MotA
MALAQRSTISDQIQHTRQEAQAVRGEISSIASEVRDLLMMEIELAQAEASEATAHATKGAGFGAAAGILGLIAGIFLFMTVMFGLNELMQLWLAALITTLIAAAFAGVVAMMAKSEFKRFSPMPKRFMRSIKEDLRWAGTQMKSSAR